MMTRNTPTTLALALLLVGCGGELQDEAETLGPPTEMTLTGPAKRLCSGLWVSRRDDLEQLMYTTVLWRDDQVRDYESGELVFEIDEQLQIVSARYLAEEDAVGRARYFGDQGCVILPEHTNGVFFTPREVTSALPDADATPWPMGDLLSDAPLPDDVDQDRLDEALATLFDNKKDNRAAYIVVHRGRVIAERYGGGAHQDMQLESWSMGKSVTATLIGRLIQLAQLELDQPAPVPEWRSTPGDPRAAIRVSDLLRMSSGLRFTYTTDSEEQLAESFVPGQPDHRLGYVAPIDAFGFAISREAEHAPNSVGRYRNCDPLSLGYIVRRIVEEELGEAYHSWPQRALFDKIGSREWMLETDAYGNFLMTGYNFGTARDWARLGQLYLQRGMWEGEQLLPEEFVEFVATPAPAWSDGAYGGMFWRNAGRVEFETLPDDAYWAGGAGNQMTIVIPSRELVIVVLHHRSDVRAASGRWDRLREGLGQTVQAVDPGWSW